jgi:hypothetical protein
VLLANDSRIRKYCMRAGERHLAVPASSETGFKRAVKEAGYLVQVGETASRARSPQTQPASPHDGKRGETGGPSINEADEGNALSLGRTLESPSEILRAVEARGSD